MGSYYRTRFRRPTFSPRLPGVLATGEILESEISSLPDLIQFNARENPHHVFALQSELNDNSHGGVGQEPYEVSEITFEQLHRMVHRCARWIRKAVVSADGDSELGEQKPIALYVESGVGLFVHLAALLYLDIPALLISARLSSPSVLHLLEKTGTKTILVSQRTGLSLSQDVHDFTRVVNVQPYSTFIALSGSGYIDETEEAPRNESQIQDKGSRNALILHSSGTTGLPKPIFLTHRYILGYAACHEFPSEEEIAWVNLSTLPLYHGFGLLAPCLSLSIGMTVCFPPPSIIPATNSTLDLIRVFNCRSLMTVPSIVDDILSLADESERSKALRLLATLEFLAVGGGALKTEQGVVLAENQVKLLNHYGVTEIGAVAPIFCPRSDYDWRYLRLRTDLGLELRPIPDSEHFRLIGYPIGWEKHFEVQDELERNQASSRMEVRILGRTDDVIVLKTGEKVQPRQLEDALNADARIRTAVCVGSGFFELAVIIDPASPDADEEAMKDHVWKLLSAINPSVDHHARIMSRKAIIIKPSGKPIPRSDKGSIMRQGIHDIFKREIDDAYTAMELDSLGESFVLDPTNLEAGIRYLIATVASNRLNGESMSVDDDFFESGMDSLQTVRFARLLSSGLRKLITDEKGMPQISADLIYRNPSIKSLAAESARLVNLGGEAKTGRQADRTAEMRNLADEFIAGTVPQGAPTQTRHTVLMTGSTGNLGAHALGRLARMGSIEKIICLIRNLGPVTNGSSAVSSVEQVQSILLSRQRGALEAAGIRLEPKEWAKVELLDLACITGENEASKVRLSDLAHRVTRILHLAWPMDFHRRLESFRPHIKLLQTLVGLAQQASTVRDAEDPIRLLFSSSIAVVRYYAEIAEKNKSEHFGTTVPEFAVQDPLVAVPMGYAEAKWVCEIYLDHVAKHVPGVEPVVVRVGQLSGPEGTPGTWKTDEHMPTLIQASQKIGAFPDLEGAASWMPVDRAAHALNEILLSEGATDSFLHLENPVRQPLRDVFTIMAHELRLSRPFVIPFDQWLERVTKSGEIRSLESFFKDHFHELAGGAVTLDTVKGRAMSKCLKGSGALEKELIIEYLQRWRHEGFLEQGALTVPAK
ncbi:putative L-aminoadipate-semialdehyde dehydrogenase large subunit [Rosellinia necatrix]|uniref:Putative L-aminoadipate-semialdehyde dehydrogenase large subunit n=1 Tax=Rosellinia necatrix TaxID=77044 RepID=A0A1S7UHP6_ROSNE|nr:putative L-aminoadipate-semialdehyde dehydrogenase large subunit [Rosellinia necatrix]